MERSQGFTAISKKKTNLKFPTSNNFDYTQLLSNEGTIEVGNWVGGLRQLS